MVGAGTSMVASSAQIQLSVAPLTALHQPVEENVLKNLKKLQNRQNRVEIYDFHKIIMISQIWNFIFSSSENIFVLGTFRPASAHSRPRPQSAAAKVEKKS